VATHLHRPDGTTLSYAFTHFYRVTLRRQMNGRTARTLTLPDNPDLVILAASLTDAGGPMHADGLLDRPRRPSVSIHPAGGTFVDDMTVTMSSPSPRVRIEVAVGDGAPRPWQHEPLTFTETTEVTVTASGPWFGEDTVRRATFTRVEPWPAVDDRGRTPGLATRTYLGAWEKLPDWDTLTPHGQSVSETVAIPAGLPEEDIGVVMFGTLDVPRRGAYRFWLSSDDGSRLWINGRLAADHDGLHGSSPLRCDVPLDAGPHTIVVEFFQHLGGRDLKLEWSGPGLARQEVPAGALRH
jgi:alpha-L-fucosidase